LRGREVPVTTGPDEGAAAGHGSLRASHADREHVIDTLKAAFADGRLDKDELDDRVGQTLAARTYAELATVTADIPAGPASAPPPRRAGRPLRRAGRPLASRSAVKWGLVGAGAMIPPAMFVTSAFVWPFPLAFVAMPLIFIELIVMLVFVITVLAKQHRERSGESRGQLPPHSGGGAEAERPGGTGHEPSSHRTRAGLPVRKTLPDRGGPGISASGGASLAPRAAWGAAGSL
jgi:hypothetical protein